MEFNAFLEKIRMPVEVVERIESFQITEVEYKKMKKLFQKEKTSFYKCILKKADFRIRFLYYYSRMAWELHESGEWHKRCKLFTEQGLDVEQIFIDTFYDLTLWCEDCHDKTGEYGFVQYDWIWRHLEGTLFRLGRLQFEVMEEEINIHIPAGEALDFKHVKYSLEVARRVWGNKKLYMCHSWLLYPNLKEILPKKSNILKFQELFTIICIDFETREAEERIFGTVKSNPAEYEVHTSLQKNAREYLTNGKVLGSGFGVLNL